MKNSLQQYNWIPRTEDEKYTAHSLSQELSCEGERGNSSIVGDSRFHVKVDLFHPMKHKQSCDQHMTFGTVWNRGKWLSSWKEGLHKI